MESVGPTRGLFRQAGVYTLATASQLLSTVLVLPVVTRWLSPSQFGEVATALIVMQAVTILAGWGLPAAITRAYFTEGGRPAARSLLATTTVVGAGTTAVLFLSGRLWATALFSSLSFEGALSRGVLLGFGLLLVTSAQALLRAEGASVRFALTAALNGLGGQALGLLNLYLASAPTPQAYLEGMLLGTGLAAAVGILWTRPRFQAGRSWSVARWGLALGIPVVPHSAALQVMNLGDRVVLERLSGLAAVGQYQVAYLVGSVGIVLIGAANNAWAPMIYGAADDERWHVLASSTAMITRFVAGLTLAIGLAVPIGFAILAPPAYATSGALVAAAIVAVATLPVTWYLANVHVLFQQGRTRRLAWASPLSAAVNIGLNLAFIPRFGLAGAALATAIAYSLQSLLIQQAAGALASVPWRTSSMARGWVVGTAGVLLATLLPDAGTWPFLRAAAAVAVGAYVLSTSVRGGEALVGGSD